MASFKVSPFTSLGSSNSVVNDDFVHSTLETYKLKGTTTNGSKFDCKIKVKPNKDGQLTYDDEAKLQFPVFDRYTVQLGQRRNGQLRLHADLGEFTLAGKKWNLFSNLKTTTALDKHQFRLGANFFGEVCESNTRLEVAPNADAVITHRNWVKKGALTYGLVGSLNLTSFALTRYDAVLGYSADKYIFQLKHESCSKANAIKLGKLTTSLTYNHDANTKLGAELVTEGSEFKPALNVAALRKVNSDLTVKGKVDDKLNLSLASKYTLNKQITITAALQLALKSGKPVDFSKFPPLPFGVQFDVAV